MPQIFNEAGRERVRVLLLENGFDLIKTHGLKKTSISFIIFLKQKRNLFIR